MPAERDPNCHCYPYGGSPGETCKSCKSNLWLLIPRLEAMEKRLGPVDAPPFTRDPESVEYRLADLDDHVSELRDQVDPDDGESLSERLSALELEVRVGVTSARIETLAGELTEFLAEDGIDEEGKLCEVSMRDALVRGLPRVLADLRRAENADAGAAALRAHPLTPKVANLILGLAAVEKRLDAHREELTLQASRLAKLEQGATMPALSARLDALEAGLPALVREGQALLQGTTRIDAICAAIGGGLAPETPVCADPIVPRLVAVEKALGIHLPTHPLESSAPPSDHAIPPELIVFRARPILSGPAEVLSVSWGGTGSGPVIAIRRQNQLSLVNQGEGQANAVLGAIKLWAPKRIVVDVTGLGGGLLEFIDRPGLVAFDGSKPAQDAVSFRTALDEAWGNLRKGLVEGTVILPSYDEISGIERDLREQLVARRCSFDERGTFRVESLKSVRQRGGPNHLGLAQALALLMVPECAQVATSAPDDEDIAAPPPGQLTPAETDTLIRWATHTQPFPSAATAKALVGKLLGVAVRP